MMMMMKMIVATTTIMAIPKEKVALILQFCKISAAPSFDKLMRVMMMYIMMHQNAYLIAV